MQWNRLSAAVLAIAGLLVAGCWYQRPCIEHRYAQTSIGMSREKVVKVLGKPSAIIQNEMFYLYDDPLRPVRLRYVLNEKGIVVEKFYDTKEELAKRAEEVEGEIPPTQTLPGDKDREYPGGPMDRFGKKPPGGYGGYPGASY